MASVLQLAWRRLLSLSHTVASIVVVLPQSPFRVPGFGRDLSRLHGLSPTWYSRHFQHGCEAWHTKGPNIVATLWPIVIALQPCRVNVCCDASSRSDAVYVVYVCAGWGFARHLSSLSLKHVCGGGTKEGHCLLFCIWQNTVNPEANAGHPVAWEARNVYPVVGLRKRPVSQTRSEWARSSGIDSRII